jgi:hypothetical protein
VPLIVVYFVANSTNNDTFNKVFTEFVRIHPKLSDAGFGGYSLVAPNTMQRFYIAPNATQAQANETVDPFLAFAPNLTEGLNISAALTVPYPSFYSWYTSLFSTAHSRSGRLQRWHRD